MWRVLCHNQNCGRKIFQKETWTNQNDGRYGCTVGCYCPMTEHERTWLTLPATYVRQTWSKVHDMEDKKREYKVI